MDYLSYFADSYAGARAKFLEAAESAGAHIATYTNPADSLDGDALCTDVAILGDLTAPGALLVNTGTHGVEGYAGSAALVGWLRGANRQRVHPAVKTILIHALNPYGLAWCRRANEINVDVNRNFVDHGAPYPTNAEYERLHSMLVPADLTEETLEACSRALELYAHGEGVEQLHAQVGRGQYSHPDGLYFGGHTPSWSNRTFCTILAEWVAGTERVVFLDLHSGPGPFGHVQLTCSEDAAAGSLESAVACFGRAVRPNSPAQRTARLITGGVANAVRDIVLGAQITSVSAKMGCGPHEEAFEALRVDNWTHLHHEPDSEEASSVRGRMFDTACPADPDWRELVALRTRQLMVRAALAAQSRG